MESSLLKGKVVLITGGSQGLGAATSEVLASAGMQVIIGDIQVEKAESLTHDLNTKGYTVSNVSLNVMDYDNVKSVIDSIAASYHRLDVVINNAGIDVTKSISEMSVPEWDRVMAVNLRGPFLISKCSLEVMSQQKSGHIVNITSTAAKRAWPNASAYHASKWGLLGFSHALFTEARDHHVKVTAVVSGGMLTPFILDRFPDIDRSDLQDPHRVAEVIKYTLSLPGETVIPEVMVLPMKETSWP